jgi:hypothetical protein
MKNILLIFLILPLIGFGQSMNINWEDSDGREFSINSHSGDFKYSMVSGDQLYYNTGSYSDTGPEGTIKKVGSITVSWNTGSYSDTGPEGTVKKVDYTTVSWNTGSYSDTGPEGTIKKVGGLTIYYNTGSYSDTGPEGTVKKTSGSVN